MSKCSCVSCQAIAAAEQRAEKAEAERDAVGIQLDAARKRIEAMTPVVESAKTVHLSWMAGHDPVKPMAMLGAAIARFIVLPGDALARATTGPQTPEDALSAREATARQPSGLFS